MTRKTKLISALERSLTAKSRHHAIKVYVARKRPSASIVAYAEPIEVPVPTTPIFFSCSWSNRTSKVSRAACFAVSKSQHLHCSGKSHCTAALMYGEVRVTAKEPRFRLTGTAILKLSKLKDENPSTVVFLYVLNSGSYPKRNEGGKNCSMHHPPANRYAISEKEKKIDLSSHFDLFEKVV